MRADALVCLVLRVCFCNVCVCVSMTMWTWCVYVCVLCVGVCVFVVVRLMCYLHFCAVLPDFVCM